MALQLPPQNPPRLTPPDLHEDVGSSSAKRFIIILLLLLFAALSVLLYGVLVILPQKTSPLPPAAQTALPVESATSAVSTIPTVQGTLKDKRVTETETPAEDMIFKQQAEARLKHIFAMQNSFEAENIDVWGEDIYYSILSRIAEGDKYFVSKLYMKAEQAYAGAEEGLSNLLEQKETLFEEALRDGNLQLAEGNSTRAGKAFKTAIAIAPEDKKARQGMRRADNLDRVLELFSQGEEHEANDKLDLALQAFQASRDLDNQFKPAAVAVQRIAAELKQRNLTDALTQFYKALQDNNLKKAGTALQLAKDLQPKDAGVTRASEEFKRVKEEHAVLLLRVKAENESASEEWQKALDTYTKVLKIAPQADFALRGKHTATENLKLANRLDYLLNNKERLRDDKILKNAEATLQYTAGRSGYGGKMTAKISSLKTAVEQAKIPVKLVMISDNMTEVTIFHVGRLGSFFQRELVLKPGKYTVTGQRPGYRDVRNEITLTHENPVVTFTIACKETF